MKAYDLYAYNDYKPALKDRIQFLKQYKPQWTLKRLADKIPVQYTFLSKVINTESVHLSEDHLFRAAHSLEFLPEEIDYLLLLRASKVTSEPLRQSFIIKKIDQFKKSHTISAEQPKMSSASLQQEMKYLLDPLHVIAHVALSIESIQKNPRQLGSLLGITQAKVKDILELLSSLDFIDYDHQNNTVNKTKTTRIHFNREHPLMRVNQLALKTLLQSRFNQTPEAEKESFFVTFTMDEDCFHKVQELFKKFLGDVQALKKQSKSTELYQLSFDLLKWF